MPPLSAPKSDTGNPQPTAAAASAVWLRVRRPQPGLPASFSRARRRAAVPMAAEKRRRSVLRGKIPEVAGKGIF